MSEPEQEEAAMWVSCMVCDVLPGDRCKGVQEIDQLVHPERIDLMKFLKENP